MDGLAEWAHCADDGMSAYVTVLPSGARSVDLRRFLVSERARLALLAVREIERARWHGQCVSH